MFFIPTVQSGHVPEHVKEFVTKFLQQYYLLFDSDDRQSLLAAYHEQALFSYSMTQPHEPNPKFKSRPFDTSLNQENRNLLKVHGEARTKTLKQGKVNVVASLCDFPKSSHVTDSFLVDVPLCNEAMLEIVINGVFKITESKHPTLKSFSRHFHVVPQGEGFVITNDQLFMTNASIDLVKKYSNYRTGPGAEASLQGEMDAQPINDHLSHMIPSTSSSAAFNTGGDPANAQMELILSQFCMATKLKRDYAHKCLSENGYNPNRSMEIFQELHVRGQIPSFAYE